MPNAPKIKIPNLEKKMLNLYPNEKFSFHFAMQMPILRAVLIPRQKAEEWIARANDQNRFLLLAKSIKMKDECKFCSKKLYMAAS